MPDLHLGELSPDQCRFCGEYVAAERRHLRLRTCSRECTAKLRTAVVKAEGIPILTTGTSGAVAELAVSIDCLRRGFDVFRSVSPSASCDLIIVKNGKCFRVEVRTGTRGVKKPNSVGWSKNKRDTGRSDLYAVYIPFDRSVVYTLDIDTISTSKEQNTINYISSFPQPK